MRHYHRYIGLPYNPLLRDRAKQLRKAGNLSEVLLWQKINRGQFRGYDFDRQKIIGDFIVDFYCSNCNTVIEIDGPSHDGKMEYDSERDAFLQGLGLIVIHVDANEVLYRLDRVMELLYERIG